MRIADSHKQACRAEPRHSNADTDPSFHLIRIRLFNADADRILLLIKGMKICDHWSTDPPGFPFEPPLLQCERPRLDFDPLRHLNLDLYAYLDPAFHSLRIRVRIQLPKIKRILADTDPQPCTKETNTDAPI
jgi:hypothetical protein